MSASFSHSAGSVTFSRAIQRPDRALQVVQPQRSTAAAVRLGYVHTYITDTITLALRMTAAEKDSLLSFFRTVANGMAGLFNYTDPEGTSLSVRFASGALSGLREKGPDCWEISLPLHIFPSVWLFSNGSTQLYSDGTEVNYAQT